MVRSTRASRQGSIAVSDSRAGSRERSVENDENLDDTRESNISKKRERGPKRTLLVELPPVNEEEEEEEKEKKGRKGKKTEETDKKKERKLTMSEMIEVACSTEKGQKAMLKRLLSDPGEFFDKATVNEIRRILWTPAVVGCAEGCKLATLVLLYLPVEKVKFLLKKRIMSEEFKIQDAKSYGALLLSSYKSAELRDKQDGNWDGKEGKLTMEITSLLTELADAAIRVFGPVGEKFQAVVCAALLTADRAKYDGLIYRTLEPIIRKFLNSGNDKIRYQASVMFLRFFPLLERDDVSTQSISIDSQFEMMMNLMRDDVVDIRKEAAKKICRALAQFYMIIPLRVMQDFLLFITDGLSFDSIPAVRAAVIEGFAELIPVTALLNVLEKSLKLLVPRMIEDRSEKVRLAAIRLLAQLRDHRLLKYHSICPLSDLMARLEVESSDAVRREIVKLTIKTFMPGDKGGSADARLERIVRLTGYGREAALSIHRLMVPLELVSVEDAVTHLKNMCIAVYKNWRKGMPESDSMCSLDGDTTMGSMDVSAMSNMSSMSLADNSAMAVPALDESAPVFKRDKIILECAVVLWATVARDLRRPEYEKIKVSCDKLMAKIFRKMFGFFRHTSLLGTVMCIGTLLPSQLLEEYSIQILNILKEKTVDDAILEPYLETGASWRLEELMEMIREGLAELPAVLGVPGTSSTSASPARKRVKKNKLSAVERIRQALHYLKYSLEKQPISARLVGQCRQQLEECFEVLSKMHPLMDAYLHSMESNEGWRGEDERAKSSLTPDDLVSLYDSATVLAIMLLQYPSTSGNSAAAAAAAEGAESMTSAAGEEEEERQKTDDSPSSLFLFGSLLWLEQSLMMRMSKSGSVDRTRDRLQIRLAQKTLQHAESVLAALPSPPAPPSPPAAAALMERVMRGWRMNGGGGGSSEEEEEEPPSSARRSSIASTVSTMDGPPQREYLEVVRGVVLSMSSSTMPVDVLKGTLRLAETVMATDSEVGEEMRANPAILLDRALNLLKRVAESPLTGEELTRAHMDNLLSFTRVAYAKVAGGLSTVSINGFGQKFRCLFHRFMKTAVVERGVEDVSEHTYELHPFIELALHRFIFRVDSIYKDFRSNLASYAIHTLRIVKESDPEARGKSKEELEEKNEEKYESFVIACQLLRLSAPETRKAVIKEKKNENARRSVQADIDSVTLLEVLEEFKKERRMDEGTETILREMIGPY